LAIARVVAESRPPLSNTTARRRWVIFVLFRVRGRGASYHPLHAALHNAAKKAKSQQHCRNKARG
jgi:hypothetical protein